MIYVGVVKLWLNVGRFRFVGLVGGICLPDGLFDKEMPNESWFVELLVISPVFVDVACDLMLVEALVFLSVFVIVFITLVALLAVGPFSVFVSF